MKSIRYISLGLLLIAGQSYAQNLSTEVVVDRTIQPKEHAATRLGGLTPVLVLPGAKPETLSTARFTTLSPLTRSYTRLDPATGGRAAEQTPYKGYAALGYFPSVNVGASAGYRILDNEKFTLGAALQFDGESYKSFGKDFMPDRKNAQWYTRLGVDFSYRPKEKSELSAALAYSYLKDKTWAWDWQSVNSLGLDLGWKSSTDKFDYTLGIYENFEKSGDYDYLYSYVMPRSREGLTQNQFGLNGDISMPVADTSRFGVALNADFVHTNHPDVDGGYNPDRLVGTVGLKPFYGLNMDNVTARVGLDVDFGVGDRGKVHVAPDIMMQWVPSSQFGLWVSAGGGDVLNPFSSRRQITNYQVFSYGFDRSNIPLIVEGGLNFGPFTGFTAEIYGGYAKANKWYMTSTVDNCFIAPVNLKGWHAGVRFGYESGIVKASAGAEIAPSKYDKAWLYNYDRAKYIITVAVDVKPIDKLTVGVGYEFRGHRGYTEGPDEWYSLGCVSDLSVHADYDLLPWLTVFGRGENLLGRRYDLLYRLLSQKQKGAIGLAVKF